jgi:cytochrome c1
MLTHRRSVLAELMVATASVTLLACRSHDHAQIISGARADRAGSAIGRYGCGSCHTIPGIHDATATVAPSLARFGQRGVIAGMLPFTPENLVQWIMHPQQEDPGVAMPDMGVSEQDAKDIAEYLLHLGT